MMNFGKTLVMGMLFAAGTAFAAGGGQKSQESGMESGTQQQSQQDFQSLDQDRDGNISRTEAQQHPQLSSQFQELDADEDGQLSSEEFSEMQQQTQDRMNY